MLLLGIAKLLRAKNNKTNKNINYSTTTKSVNFEKALGILNTNLCTLSQKESSSISANGSKYIAGNTIFLALTSS